MIVLHEMGHFERALEWLRPLILGSTVWDYCVVWKLGDDPSRFIEWVDCCCNGGGNQEAGIKKKRKERDLATIPACKDTTTAHPASTKSCEALARLPPYMSLNSGSIHGEVVISSQPLWLNLGQALDLLTPNEESLGTQVLIPVVGGLIELFSTKPVAENEAMVEYILAQFSGLQAETAFNSPISFDGQYVNPLLESLSSLNQLHITQVMTQIAQQCSDSTLGGSSTGSILTEEHLTPASTPRSVSQTAAFPLQPSCQKDVVVKEEPDQGQRAEKKQCKSKNLLTERRRRQRINDGMLTLRSLVPKITKMHKTAILADAVDYIKELQEDRKKLLEELEDCDKSICELTASRLDGVVLESGDSKTLKQEGAASSLAECPKSQLRSVQVEVNQLGNGSYLLQISCQQSLGAFTKLVEAISSMGVLVDNVNVTVCNGTLSSNIMVQTNKEIQAKDLRDSLMQLSV